MLDRRLSSIPTKASLVVTARNIERTESSQAATSDDPPSAGKVQEPREHLRALTGLRIIAALMIVFFHSSSTFSIDHKFDFSKLSLVQGVSLFFVLSGFILTYTYSSLEGFRAAKKFIAFRLARIWPVHLVTALFALAFVSHKWMAHAYVVLPNLCLVQDWIPINNFFFSLNAVSWSVSAELFFYCCFPFLNVAMKKRPLIVVLGSFTTAMFFVYISQFFQVPGVNTDRISSFGLVYVNPVVRLFEFVIGIATARIFLRYRADIAQWSARKIAIIEICVLVSVLVAVAVVKQTLSGAALDAVVPNLSVWVDGSSGVFAYAALILLLAVQKGQLYKLLSKPTFVWLGEISYSVYLVHWLWIKIFVNANFAQYHLPRLGAFALYLTAVMASAALLYHFVEKPARNYFGGKIRAWK